MSFTIDFDLRVEGEELPDAFLDPYELELMFDDTRRSLGAALERKFGDVLCAEHCPGAQLHHPWRLRQ